MIRSLKKIPFTIPRDNLQGLFYMDATAIQNITNTNYKNSYA